MLYSPVLADPPRVPRRGRADVETVGLVGDVDPSSPFEAPQGEGPVADPSARSTPHRRLQIDVTVLRRSQASVAAMSSVWTRSLKKSFMCGAAERPKDTAALPMIVNPTPEKPRKDPDGRLAHHPPHRHRRRRRGADDPACRLCERSPPSMAIPTCPRSRRPSGAARRAGGEPGVRRRHGPPHRRSGGARAATASCCSSAAGHRPGSAGRGLGTLLLAAVEERGREAGATEAELFTGGLSEAQPAPVRARGLPPLRRDRRRRRDLLPKVTHRLTTSPDAAKAAAPIGTTAFAEVRLTAWACRR